jgi:hypothetical protein
MSTNWTQAWVAPGDSFFISKNDQFIAPDPLIIQSINGSTMTLSVGGDNTASITTAGIGGANANSITFEDKGIIFNPGLFYDTMIVGDDVEIDTNLFIQTATASNYLKISSDNSFNDYSYNNSTDSISLFRFDSDGRMIFASGAGATPQFSSFIVQTNNVAFQASFYSFCAGRNDVNTIMAFAQNDPAATGVNRGMFIQLTDVSNAPGVNGGILRFSGAGGLNDTFDIDTSNKAITVTGSSTFTGNMLNRYTGNNTGVLQFAGGGGDTNYGGSIYTNAGINGLQIEGANLGTSTPGALKLMGNVITIGGALAGGGATTTEIVGALNINGYGVVSPGSLLMGSFVPPGNYSGYGGYTINVPITIDMANRNSIILEFQIYVSSGDIANPLTGVRVTGTATGFGVALTNVLLDNIPINYSGYCAGQLILYTGSHYNFTSTSLNIGISSTGGRLDVSDPAQNNQIYYRTTYSLIGYT